jgi:hypothetical protein
MFRAVPYTLTYSKGINSKIYNCPVLILKHSMGNTPCSTGRRGNCDVSNLMIINKGYAQNIIKNSLLHSKIM